MTDKINSIKVPMPDEQGSHGETMRMSVIEAILLMHDLEVEVGKATCSYPNYDYKKYLKKDKEGRTIRAIDLESFKY